MSEAEYFKGRIWILGVILFVALFYLCTVSSHYMSWKCFYQDWVRQEISRAGK